MLQVINTIFITFCAVIFTYGAYHDEDPIGVPVAGVVLTSLFLAAYNIICLF